MSSSSNRSPAPADPAAAPRARAGARVAVLVAALAATAAGAALLAIIPVTTASRALAATGTIRSSGAPELVVYSNDFALVREPKTLALSQGAGEVALEGLPLRVD